MPSADGLVCTSGLEPLYAKRPLWKQADHPFGVIHSQIPQLDRAEAENALRLLMQKYPEQKSLPPSLPMPTPETVRIFRLTPTIVSLLDYSKGFGHTDLVTC